MRWDRLALAGALAVAALGSAGCEQSLGLDESAFRCDPNANQCASGYVCVASSKHGGYVCASGGAAHDLDAEADATEHAEADDETGPDELSDDRDDRDGSELDPACARCPGAPCDDGVCQTPSCVVAADCAAADPSLTGSVCAGGRCVDCSSDDDCEDAACVDVSVADLVRKRCSRVCVTSTDCGAWTCSAGACRPCEGAIDCVPPMVCDLMKQACVESCGFDADCLVPAGEVCLEGYCIANGSYASCRIDDPCFGLGCVGGRCIGNVELLASASDVSNPDVSGEGRFVVFASSDNLSGLTDGTHGQTMIYRHDRLLDRTECLSCDGDLAWAASSWFPSISADGNTVVFSTSGANAEAAVDVVSVLWEEGGTQRFFPTGATETVGEPELSRDGSVVVFHTRQAFDEVLDTNTTLDIYAYDVTNSGLRLLSRDLAGAFAGDSDNPSIGSSRWVAFEADASNFGGIAGRTVVVRCDLSPSVPSCELVSGSEELLPNGDCLRPSIANDGLQVAYESLASNLVTEDEQTSRSIYVWDEGSTTYPSMGFESGGSVACSDPQLDEAGARLVFDCASTSSHYAVATSLLGNAPVETATSNEATSPSISGDGRTLVWVQSDASSHLVVTGLE